MLQRVLFFLAIVGLLGALAHFATLRFQRGDLFPAYSTFRSDPLGAKVLFQSLKQVQNVSAVRNLDDPKKLANAPGTTTIFLGLNEMSIFKFDDWMLQLARDGGRVILALDARESKNNKPFAVRPMAPAGGAGTNTNAVPFLGLNSILGLDVRRMFSSTNELEAVPSPEAEGLPGPVFWFGDYYVLATNDWRALYSVNGNPVVVEKKHGLGSVMVIADSYPFSNEALHANREAEFLAWVLGPGALRFDETHLGIQRGTGVAVLMREFRLHGLAIACLILVSLWIWRNTTPLVPPPPTGAEGESAVEGKTARQAIVHLLRRNLNDADVLSAGLEEWAKAHPPRQYWETVRLEEARNLVKHYAASPKSRDLVAMQKQLSEILFPKRN